MDADDDFGPHRAILFDFTILFEQSILSLLPTGLFLLLVPLKLFLLRNNEKLSRSGTLLWLKLVGELKSATAFADNVGRGWLLCLRTDSLGHVVVSIETDQDSHYRICTWPG